MPPEAHEAKRQSCTEIMVELVHNGCMMRWPKGGAGQDLADLILYRLTRLKHGIFAREILVSDGARNIK